MLNETTFWIDKIQRLLADEFEYITSILTWNVEIASKFEIWGYLEVDPIIYKHVFVYLTDKGKY